MTDEQKSSQIEIIALDFYDGATEGFALSVGELGVSYFKLIAWDENQDQRLFVVVSIEKLIFNSIFRLLSFSNSAPSSSVWLPNWSFKNHQDETEANEIIDASVTDIKSKGILVLGDQVDSESITTFMIKDDFVPFIFDAMQEPESLESWLMKLKEA